MATATLDRMATRYSLEVFEAYVKSTKETSLKEGASALWTKEYDRALWIFQRLSEEQGRSFETELDKVLSLSGLGELDKSVGTLRQMKGLGDDRVVLLQLGLYMVQVDQHDEALRTFSEVADRWPDDADVWVFRSPPLVSLGRFQEPVESLEKAFAPRSQWSNSGIWSLCYISALVLLLLGLASIEVRSLPDLETFTKDFIWWGEEARRDNQAGAFEEGSAAAEQFMAEKMEAYEEFMLSVRLGLIEDQFEGWKALVQEIGKVWLEGVSAVDAIKEQRY